MKRVAIVASALAIVFAAAGIAAAQEAGGGYIQAAGGVTFGGGKSSPVIGAEGGYAVTSELTIYGSFGHVLNMFDTDLEDALEDECPSCDIDASLSFTFLTGGAKYAFPTGGTIRPYVAGGIGFGRLKADVEIEGEDVTDVLFDEDSSTEGVFEFGGGIDIPVGTSNKLDIGYRAMKLFEDDTDVLHRVYAAFGWVF